MHKTIGVCNSHVVLYLPSQQYNENTIVNKKKAAAIVFTQQLVNVLYTFSSCYACTSKHIFKPASYYLDAVCRIELHTSIVIKSCCELFKITSLEANN